MTGSITALSSRGLGRRPLTAVTRVRIPLGLNFKTSLRRGFFILSVAGRDIATNPKHKQISEPRSHIFVAVVSLSRGACERPNAEFRQGGGIDNLALSSRPRRDDRRHRSATR